MTPEAKVVSWRRQRGLGLAVLLTALTLGFQLVRHRDRSEPLDGSGSLGVEPSAYLAMTESPAFFTVSPWGYRLLTPFVASTLPFQSAESAFRAVRMAALGLASVLLFVYLRRLGHCEWVSLLGVAAFGLSSPVSAMAGSPFGVEPLTVAMEIALLIAWRSGWHLGWLSLVAMIGTLSNEVFFLIAAGVGLQSHRKESVLPDIAAAGLMIAPAVIAYVLLRSTWGPRAVAPWTLDLTPDLSAALVGGLVPLAALAAFRRSGRHYLRENALLLACAFAIPVVGAYDETVSRLFIYTVPILLPLCILLFIPTASGSVERRLRWPTSRREYSIIAASLALASVPAVVTDDYARYDLRGTHDGAFVRAFCRESLRLAERLRSGERVVLHDEEALSRAAAGQSRRALYWYLRGGWLVGADPRVPEVPAPGSATMIVPILEPDDVTLTLLVSAPAAGRFRLEGNGTELDTVEVGMHIEPVSVTVPARALFRGDNVVRFLAETTGPRVHRVTMEPKRRLPDSIH